MEGLGPTLSITAVAILLLSLYTLLEIWIGNQTIQMKSEELLPRHVGDLWTSSELRRINHNQTIIDNSRKILSIMKKKLYFSILLVLLSMLLVLVLFYNLALVAFGIGLATIGAGILLMVVYTSKHYMSTIIEIEPLSYGISFLVVAGIQIILVSVVWATHVRVLPILGAFIALTYVFYQILSMREPNTSGVLNFNKMELQGFYLRERSFSPLFIPLLSIVVSYIMGKYALIYIILSPRIVC